MCKIIEDWVKEERAEAAAEGAKEKATTVALRMLDAGKYALDEIADISGLSLEEVQKLQASQGV